MRAILLLFLATAAAAQPSGSDLVDRWRSDWDAAVSRASLVSMDESTERLFIGPRRETTIEVDGRIEYDFDGPPERTVRRVRIDGEDVSAERERRHRGRLSRAFGPAGREVSAPPPLAVALLD
ncbi:hypothetical protein, partial [Rubrivirga sp.]|uniref:hypothetical protein n=1 Tax=Rubrivirga sp. TaxID=1885344 RepID=UPI003C77C50D